MKHPADRQAEFEQLYSKRRRYQNILAVVVLPMMLVMRLSMNPEAGTVFGVPVQFGFPAMLLFVVGATIFSRKNWRCPACGKYLGAAFRGPRHCPNCGVKLRA